MEAARQEIVKITHNIDDRTIFYPAEILIESLNPTLEIFCKAFYKQHIKLSTKHTYINKREAKSADKPHRKKENSEEDQSQDNKESRTYEDNKVIPDANDNNQ